MAILSEASEQDGSAEASLLLSVNAQFHMDQAVSAAIEQVAACPTHTYLGSGSPTLVMPWHVYFVMNLDGVTSQKGDNNLRASLLFCNN